MPRGMKGTGPGARKRLQREGKVDEQYVKLYLTEEEARLIFEGLRQLPLDMGTRAGAVTMNILYRITEQVMTREEAVGTSDTHTQRKAKAKARGYREVKR